MSLTALVIGDPHFKVNNVPDTRDMVAAIIKIAQERQPSFIVVLGDILDRHETIHVSPLTRAVDFIRKLWEIAPTYVLIGNHDLINNQQFLSPEHPFAALKLWDHNLVVIDRTLTTTIGDLKFTFVPYVPPGRFVEALEVSPGWEASTCIFAHQEFRGVRQGAITSVHGDIWPVTHPYVITGHIHDYQELQSNIVYVGTPIQHTYGDTHDKTISLFTFSGSDRTQERIDLGLRRKYVMRIPVENITTQTLIENANLKIVILGTAAQLKTMSKHPTVKSWEKAGHLVVTRPLASTSPAESSASPVRSPAPPRAPPRFSSVLMDVIATDTNVRLIPLYQSIFGQKSAGPTPRPVLRLMKK